MNIGYEAALPRRSARLSHFHRLISVLSLIGSIFSVFCTDFSLHNSLESRNVGHFLSIASQIWRGSLNYCLPRTKHNSFAASKTIPKCSHDLSRSTQRTMTFNSPSFRDLLWTGQAFIDCVTPLHLPLLTQIISHNCPRSFLTSN